MLKEFSKWATEEVEEYFHLTLQQSSPELAAWQTAEFAANQLSKRFGKHNAATSRGLPTGKPGQRPTSAARSRQHD